MKAEEKKIALVLVAALIMEWISFSNTGGVTNVLGQEPVYANASTSSAIVAPSALPTENADIISSEIPKETPVVSLGTTPAAVQVQDILPEGFDEIIDVKVDKKKIAMGVGEKYQINAQVVPTDASNQSLDYIVISGNCISVNKKGKIEALNAGSAKVLVEAFNGKLAVVEVTVKQPPKRISLNKRMKAMKKGRIFQIKVKFPKNTASANLKYNSSNKKVAKVTATGKVKALRKGRTVITVKTFNKKKAKMTIIVR